MPAIDDSKTSATTKKQGSEGSGGTIYIDPAGDGGGRPRMRLPDEMTAMPRLQGLGQVR